MENPRFYKTESRGGGKLPYKRLVKLNLDGQEPAKIDFKVLPSLKTLETELTVIGVSDRLNFKKKE